MNEIILRPPAQMLDAKAGKEYNIIVYRKRETRESVWQQDTKNERKRFLMANKSTKIRKSMSAGSKGCICLVILLAATIFVSFLALAGLNLDAEGVNVLLPWVPTSSQNWVKSLPVNRTLGGGLYTEYAYTLPEGAEESAVQDSVNTIRTRLQQMGETDAQVTAEGGNLRIVTRAMDESRLASLRNLATMGGKFEFTDSEGNVLLTEKDVESAAANVNYNSTRTSYTISLVFSLTKEWAQKLADASVSYVSVTCDGDSVASFAIVSGNTVSASMGSTDSAYNTAANLAFLKNHGAVDATLNLRGTGEVEADSGIVLKVVLIVSAALLVCALVYLVAAGKLTGVSAFLSVWCALVLGLFFVATIVVPSVTMLDTGCLIAALLGILLAIYAAVTRTDAVSKQIGEGSTPKQATKLGPRIAAKNVWIVHGAVLAVSLVMMLIPFLKSTGYTLAAGVVASAVAVLVMRAFQACFTAMTGKPSLFGKVK